MLSLLKSASAHVSSAEVRLSGFCSVLPVYCVSLSLPLTKLHRLEVVHASNTNLIVYCCEPLPARYVTNKEMLLLPANIGRIMAPGQSWLSC